VIGLNGKPKVQLFDGPIDRTSPRSIGVEALEKIRSREAVVGVVGLGYVGLPLARSFSRAGFRVLGFDLDAVKVHKLQNGRGYIASVPDETVVEMAGRGFSATDRFARLDEPDAILICVPTPLTESREPDLSFVMDSAVEVAERLRPGQIVVLESTTYPGTTRDVVRPILEATGLRCGQDFFLAFSPEREDPGNAQHSGSNIPKVVGGCDAQSQELAVALYAGAMDRVVPVSSCEVAEACKILENTYRAVNIALVNELKLIFGRMGIDVWEVIDAAKTKPFGFQAFYPGPGLGGHCIPIDPFYLTWAARKFGAHTRFIELAGEINTSMPGHVVDRVAAALNERGKPVKGSRITILGIAYKRDVDDPRESPGVELLHRLRSLGAFVSYNDPHIPALPPMRRHPRLRLASSDLTPEFLDAQDCVVIVADHSAYNWPWIVERCPLVVDTRGVTRGLDVDRERVVMG